MSADTLRIPCPHCDTANRVPRERLRERPKCGRCKQPLFAGHPVVLTTANFDQQIGVSDIPIVVDFWAPWCGPCRVMAPAFEKAAAELEPNIRLAKLDTEAEPQLASRFAIRAIPTLAVFRDGQEVARRSGALDYGTLVRWLQTY